MAAVIAAGLGCGTAPVEAVDGARPLPESVRAPQIGAGGMSFKYKRVSGPYDFGGDMLMWGGHAFGGGVGEVKLGISGAAGILNGKYARLDLKMGGLTLENGFRPDPLFKWRVGFGMGSYDLVSTVTKFHTNRGNFAYLEPMLVGVRPLTRHISIEVGVGYTFANSTGVKLDGFCLTTDLLLGRF